MEAIVQQALENNILQVGSSQSFQRLKTFLWSRRAVDFLGLLLPVKGAFLNAHSYNASPGSQIRLLCEQAVKNVEDQLDNTLQALENLDADDIENMRQRRLDQMKRAAAQKQEWSR